VTAIICFERSGVIHFLSDSQVTLYETGERIGSLPKVLPLPHLGCVLGVQGDAQAAFQIMFELGRRASCFDDALGALPEATKAAKEAYIKAGGAGLFATVIAGFSSGEPNIGYCISDEALGHAPFVVHDVRPIMACPSTEDLYRWIEDHVDLAADPATFAVSLIDIQRKTSIRPDGSSMAGHIGGKIIHTTITPRTITQRVVGELP